MLDILVITRVVAVGGLFEALARVMTARAEGLRGVDEVSVAKLLVREFIYFSAEHPQLNHIINQECKFEGHAWTGWSNAYYILTGGGSTMFVLAPECRRLAVSTHRHARWSRPTQTP
ncbi:hypothetical protein IU450_35195 [Nocardia abscessus]|uniref:hypothetical protein n=1 Tax=Nocardia abscessus TaxID=120957 RepID=UPI001894B8BA|nr:hypothetical protein [Nocardia abscessus]MBF6341101.1 hypothetical protein [Nocardia abscessus]